MEQKEGTERSGVRVPDGAKRKKMLLPVVCSSLTSEQSLQSLCIELESSLFLCRSDSMNEIGSSVYMCVL
jgi:hypothetical protein